MYLNSDVVIGLLHDDPAHDITIVGVGEQRELAAKNSGASHNWVNDSPLLIKGTSLTLDNILYSQPGASKPKEVKLLSWPTGIKADAVVFDAMPRGADRSHMYFTYGADDSRESDGKDPTGVWLHVVGNRGMIVVVR